MLHTSQSVDSYTPQYHCSLSPTLKANKLTEYMDIIDHNGNRTILNLIKKSCAFLMPKKSSKLQT